ncbi:hypothetical protein RRG08_037232 [Elysia crispata]|nr:hypothetical protein RRG08_037232 [Elysia crispata]
MIESGAGDLPHDKILWEYLDSLGAELTRMQQYAEMNPESVKLLLKQPPSTNNDGTTGDDEMRGTLHYFFDAVMPFLQVFCRSYYQPDEMYPEEPGRLATLTKAFEGFMDAIAPRISIERQMKNLISAITALITASNAISMSKIEDFRAKYSGRGGQADIRSDARRILTEVPSVSSTRPHYQNKILTELPSVKSTRPQYQNETLTELPSVSSTRPHYLNQTLTELPSVSSTRPRYKNKILTENSQVSALRDFVIKIRGVSSTRPHYQNKTLTELPSVSSTRPDYQNKTLTELPSVSSTRPRYQNETLTEVPSVSSTRPHYQNKTLTENSQVSAPRDLTIKIGR